MYICLQLVYLPTRAGWGVFSYLWPLRIQGWHAITKTALSITLTDRLKRGFNSYSSPWALHHQGRYPSTSLLSLFIVSSCQSLGGSAERPAAPEEGCVFWLIRRSWVGRVQRQRGETLSLNSGVVGVFASPGCHPSHRTQEAWWRFSVELAGPRSRPLSCSYSCLSQRTVLPSRGWPCQSPFLSTFLCFLNNPSEKRLCPCATPFSCRGSRACGL